VTAGPPTDAFEMVVGLEVHVQLATATKIFCRCSTDFGAEPNTNVCPVCLALPGALPVLNARAVELAARAACALGCTIHPVSVFARKNYFYPDLPKGYQISQFDEPLATGGSVRIGATAAGGPRAIGVTRVHMEEDAGKSLHDRYPSATAIDLNRAGVPLIEIVSEPDIRSVTEASTYLRLVKQLLEYAGVSDVSMERGSLRVDANVSARRRGEKALGTRTEIKNMNSFSAVERALETEFARQCGVLASGERVRQQTMLWDGAAGVVRAARGKEESHDYRYFPEPDLPPLVLDSAFLDRIRSTMPELPAARRVRMAGEYAGLTEYDLDALTASPAVADYFERVVRAERARGAAGEATDGRIDGKPAANWVMGEVMAALRGSGGDIEHFAIRPHDLAGLLDIVREGIVSHTAAKRIFALMASSGDPPLLIAERQGLLRVSDDLELERWLDEVFAANPDEAGRFRAGEQRLQGVLVGLVMKASGGRADPKRVNQLLAGRVGR
jgi:aspartyl-tRNA(Asn)/glutamyl-tRNA(Gln) amidotransferase subunit B